MGERNSLPILDRARCTDCGECVPVCEPGALGLVDERLEFVEPSACDYCGACEEVCGEEAISCPYEIVPDADPGRRSRE